MCDAGRSKIAAAEETRTSSPPASELKYTRMRVASTPAETTKAWMNSSDNKRRKRLNREAGKAGSSGTLRPEGPVAPLLHPLALARAAGALPGLWPTCRLTAGQPQPQPQPQGLGPLGFQQRQQGPRSVPTPTWPSCWKLLQPAGSAQAPGSACSAPGARDACACAKGRKCLFSPDARSVRLHAKSQSIS